MLEVYVLIQFYKKIIYFSIDVHLLYVPLFRLDSEVVLACADYLTICHNLRIAWYAIFNLIRVCQQHKCPIVALDLVIFIIFIDAPPVIWVVV